MSQRRKPIKPRALGVLACGKEHVCRAVVVHILAMDGILNVDWAVAFSQHSGIGSQKGTANFHEVGAPGNQNGREGGEQAQIESQAEEAHGEELWTKGYSLWEKFVQGRKWRGKEARVIRAPVDASVFKEIVIAARGDVGVGGAPSFTLGTTQSLSKEQQRSWKSEIRGKKPDRPSSRQKSVSRRERERRRVSFDTEDV